MAKPRPDLGPDVVESEQDGSLWTLTDRDPVPFYPNAAEQARDWKIGMDMNGDGVFTISDVWELLYSLFYYPGDYVVQTLIGTELGKFLEISAASYGGIVSFVLSLIVWGPVFIFAFLMLIVVGGVFEEYRSKTREEKGLWHSEILELILIGGAVYLLIFYF